MVGSGTGTPGQVFFETLMLRLAQNPPPVQEAGLVASFALAGIRSSTTPTATTATPAQTATWDTAYTQGLAKLTAESQRLSSTRGAWKFPDPNTATPGTDYALRALTARFGLFALPSSESIYPSTGGDGTVAKVLQLPAQLPVDPRGFWSLTMYGSDGFLVSNPIDRYSISDRTPGVQREADGTLKIYLQCSDPGGALTANWLPAPCGAFAMSMRLYLPTAAALDPAFTLPPLN
jgi:hypothetical protein